MSAPPRTTHYCFLPTGHTISDNNGRGGSAFWCRLTALKVHRAALKSVTGDNLMQRSAESDSCLCCLKLTALPRVKYTSKTAPTDTKDRRRERWNRNDFVHCMTVMS
jgi:hypothetical protein